MSNNTESIINVNHSDKVNKNKLDTKHAHNGTDLPEPKESHNTAFNHRFIIVLRIVMIVGLMLILLGVYFHMYSDTIKSMGVTGIIISACCVAIGMILSLPTKIYLTFVLVNHEQAVIQVKRTAQRRETSKK